MLFTVEVSTFFFLAHSRKHGQKQKTEHFLSPICWISAAISRSIHTKSLNLLTQSFGTRYAMSERSFKPSRRRHRQHESSTFISLSFAGLLSFHCLPLLPQVWIDRFMTQFASKMSQNRALLEERDMIAVDVVARWSRLVSSSGHLSDFTVSFYCCITHE
jgi:hypothetical protein